MDTVEEMFQTAWLGCDAAWEGARDGFVFKEENPRR